MDPDELPRIAHDPEALESFYREHVEAVGRFVARRVDDPHTAADLTAEVFLAAIASAPGYRPDRGAPVAWLFGVARNVVSAEHRRASRERAANARIQGRRLLDDDDIARLQERIDAEAAGRELLRRRRVPPRRGARGSRARRRRRADGRRGGRGPRHPAGHRPRPLHRARHLRRHVSTTIAVTSSDAPRGPPSASCGVVADESTAPPATGGDPAAPAYAVQPHGDGSVTVTINGLRDADGLERALRDEGVRAVVDYLPAGATCAPGRFRPAAAGEAGRSQLRQGADGSVSFTIDRGTVAPGATLVIESSGGDGGPTTMSIAVADGDVGPCRS